MTIAGSSRSDHPAWWRGWSGIRHTVHRIAKAPLHLYLDFPTRIASGLQEVGLRDVAETFLWRVYCAHPYDCSLGEYLANMIYDNRQHDFGIGTIERGQFIMRTLERSFPSEHVTTAYFANIHELMRHRERNVSPGQIVLGLGAGRCGSTTLGGILHLIEGAVSTHEAPPHLFWEPLARQLQFHLRRFQIFSQYFPLTADCAHWWINVVDDVFDAFPTAKAIGVYRDTEACVRSWMTISPPDVNHWVLPHNQIWLADAWDPLYPHYDLPDDAKRNPMATKEVLVRRYVTEYNARLKEIAARRPDRVLLLRTEELDLPATRRRISDFIKLQVGISEIKLNVGRDNDAASHDGIYF